MIQANIIKKYWNVNYCCLIINGLYKSILVFEAGCQRKWRVAGECDSSGRTGQFDLCVRFRTECQWLRFHQGSDGDIKAI